MYISIYICIYRSLSSKIMLIPDGTEWPIAKLSDNTIQRLSYSMKDKQNTIRTVFIVTPNCQIFDILPEDGLFVTDKNSDPNSLDWILLSNIGIQLFLLILVSFVTSIILI